MRSLFLVLAASLVLTACSHDGSSSTNPTTPTPTTVYSIVLDSGVVDSTTAPAGSVVPVRVHVRLSGTLIGGIGVAWSVGTGHGALSAATTSTDSLGVATVLWTLSDTSGMNSITAVAGDGSVSWRVVGVAGPASSLIRVSSDSSVVVAGGTIPLTARVIDRHGNAVGGADVEWTSSGGTLSVTTGTTGATGNADSNFTAPSVPGVYTVTATLPGRASVTFEIVAL